MSKFARRSINCEKLEKSQFLLKLLNSVCKLKGGRRVPSKNCVFCDCSMVKNWEKLAKMQFFLKLLNSSFKLLHFFQKFGKCWNQSDCSPKECCAGVDPDTMGTCVHQPQLYEVCSPRIPVKMTYTLLYFF